MCESDLQEISFHIQEVRYGWIIAVVRGKDGDIILSNSYLGGLQATKNFLVF